MSRKKHRKCLEHIERLEIEMGFRDPPKNPLENWNPRTGFSVITKNTASLDYRLFCPRCPETYPLNPVTSTGFKCNCGARYVPVLLGGDPYAEYNWVWQECGDASENFSVTI